MPFDINKEWHAIEWLQFFSLENEATYEETRGNQHCIFSCQLKQ